MPQTVNPQNSTYEEPALYVFDYVLTANQAIIDLARSIDKDSGFLLTRIHGTSTGPYQLNIKLPNSRPIASSPIQSANLIGTAPNPVFIGPPIFYIGGSRIAIDLTDTSGAQNTIQIVFAGIRRYVTQAA